MPIHIDSARRIFTLHTNHSTYQMMADDYGLLRHLYYGPRAAGDAAYLYVPADRGFAMQPADAAGDRTYSPDVLPQEYPCFGNGDTRSAAFVLQNPDGSIAADLRYRDCEVLEGKYTLRGLPCTYEEQPREGGAAEDPELERAQTLKVTLSDAVSGVEVQLLYGVFPREDLITRSVLVCNRGGAAVTLRKVLSANLDFLYGRFEFLTFYGRHAMERNLQRQEIAHGEYQVGSRRGASSHQYNPLTILAEHGADETSGSCWAMEFVWSGGFTALVGKDQVNQTRWQMGLQEEGFSYPLPPGETFTAPEVLMSFSDRGFEQLSLNLHDGIRRHLLRGHWMTLVRPLLLNSWEGCYFDFDGERILGLADEAAALGLDMLVLDDGWFGHREDDNSSLGDWYVNERKLGMKLPELIRAVHGKGLLFGIWIEPEMISDDSALYRAHPDYVLAIPGRGPVHGRNQLVLDFSRKEVVDCIFDQLKEAFREETPDYIKWDFNRTLYESFSRTADDQGRVFYDYMCGTYELLRRVEERWPGILIEGCAGGGGRFDAGMLYYTPQIWCSDNTDAIDRLFIQYGTSFGYPAFVMGSHVSVSPNEQNGRVTALGTRGAVALAGTSGYELDPLKLSDEDREEIRRQEQLHRKFAALSMEGDYLRLTNPCEDPVTAWEIVAKDGSEALVTAVTCEIRANAPQIYIRPRRLMPGAMYRSESDGRVYSADILMHAGLPVPGEMYEYASHMWHFIREA